MCCSARSDLQTQVAPVDRRVVQVRQHQLPPEPTNHANQPEPQSLLDHKPHHFVQAQIVGEEGQRDAHQLFRRQELLPDEEAQAALDALFDARQERQRRRCNAGERLKTH